MNLKKIPEIDLRKTRDGLFYISFNKKKYFINEDQYKNIKEIDKSDIMLTSTVFDEINNALVENDYPEIKLSTYFYNKEDFCERIINFFLEFDFDVSTRFLNSLCVNENPSDYVLNYFKLSGHPQACMVQEKLKSSEWIFIVEDIKKVKLQLKNVINTRLEVMFGPQGTGKTTKAIELADEVLVCHSGMLPQDMLEDFKFVDGKPSFDKTAFYKALEDGKTVVLDEFNLLPFETIRFLQSIFDGKKEINYKNRIIKIHDNFKAIATMNLFVNGVEFALPIPIVDRCANITEFKPDAKLLAACI